MAQQEYIKITSKEQLDSLLSKPRKDVTFECFILLDCGARDFKSIYKRIATKTYFIYNHIDNSVEYDSVEYISEDKLLESSIGKAISKGTLCAYQ